MNHQPRGAGPLDVSDVVRRQIVRVHILEGSEPEHSLPTDAVASIERELEVRIPDDILAIMASGSRLFCDKHGLRLDAVLDNQQRVVETEGPTDVFAVGEHPTKNGLYVLEEEWESPPFLLIYDIDARSLEPWALESWMERQIGTLEEAMLMEGDLDAQKRAGRVPTRDEIDAFEPHLA